MSWSPFALPETVTVPLRCSEGAATATFRGWTAREQLAYEDEATMLLGEAGAGAQTQIPAVIGGLRRIALRLTLQAVDGFPDVEPGVPFDPHDDRHLDRLDVNTYTELIEHAEQVQPLPGNAPGQDSALEEEPDPTRTSSMPAEEPAGVPG